MNSWKNRKKRTIELQKVRLSIKKIEELMPVKIARHQTIDSSPQHSTNQSIFTLCLVSSPVLTEYQVKEDPRISNSILCMVKKKH